jgi:SPP1 gp7 family putative phage head morphogenesis protein
VRNDDWSPRTKIERDYRISIRNIIRDVLGRIDDMSDLTNPYGILTAMSDVFSTDLYRDFALAAAKRMVTALYVGSRRTWREAAREAMKGREIYEMLQSELKSPVGDRVRDLVEQNARLITSFPQDIATRANAFVREEAEKGRRASAIADDLMRQFPDMAESRIQLIARTETSKASTALTRARSEELGTVAYVWRSSKDARVRRSHRRMDGVIVFWSDPPSPEELDREKRSYGRYHAGDTFNCRCFPVPVLRLDHVKWPARVHVDGEIRRMTRDEFASLAGGAHAAAA